MARLLDERAIAIHFCRHAATVAIPMIERRADWKRAEQSAARFFPTRSPSAVR